MINTLTESTAYIEIIKNMNLQMSESIPGLSLSMEGISFRSQFHASHFLPVKAVQNLKNNFPRGLKLNKPRIPLKTQFRHYQIPQSKVQVTAQIRAVS